jgi:hypothetical protein
MQHPTEPLSGIVRKLADGDFRGCRVWEDVTSIVPHAIPWVQQTVADKKLPPEAIQFIVKRVWWGTRFVRAKGFARSGGKWKSLLTLEALKGHFSAACMTMASTLTKAPFIATYVCAAALHARHPEMLPFRGNIRTMRGLAAHGGIQGSSFPSKLV